MVGSIIAFEKHWLTNAWRMRTKVAVVCVCACLCVVPTLVPTYNLCATNWTFLPSLCWAWKVLNWQTLLKSFLSRAIASFFITLLNGRPFAITSTVNQSCIHTVYFSDYQARSSDDLYLWAIRVGNGRQTQFCLLYAILCMANSVLNAKHFSAFINARRACARELL